MAKELLIVVHAKTGHSTAHQQQCLNTLEQIGTSSSSITKQQSAQNGRAPFVKLPPLLDIHKERKARATLYALFLRMQSHALHAKYKRPYK